MAKKIALIALLSIVINDLYAQGRLKELVVEESGWNFSVELTKQFNTAHFDGLDINIEVVSPDSLNALFLEQTNNDGRLNYTYFNRSRKSYFLKKRKPKKEKSSNEFFLEGIEWLLDEDKISISEYETFGELIDDYYNPDDVKERKDLSRYVLANPFYIDNRYLAVFSIDFVNTTNSHIRFDKQLYVESGDVLQSNLSASEVVDRLKLSGQFNQDKFQNLAMYYLPNSFVIPPSSTVKKYFAVDPFDYDFDKLKVSFDGLTKKFVWDVDLVKSSFSDSYKYYALSLNYTYDGFSQDEKKFIIYKGDDEIVMVGNTLYVPVDLLNSKVEIITISESYGKMYFGRFLFTPSEYLDLNKLRRTEVDVNLSKMYEIKKKVDK